MAEHRKACSKRLLIGAWHDQPLRQRAIAESVLDERDGTHVAITRQEEIFSQDQAGHTSPRTGKESFVTARTEPESSSRKHADANSVSGSAAQNPNTSLNKVGGGSCDNIDLEEDDKITLPTTRLRLQRSGIVFHPARANQNERAAALEDSNNTNGVIKQDAMLCLRTVHYRGSPTRSKTKHKPKWQQMLVVLTSTRLSMYRFPALIWPANRLEYEITLSESNVLQFCMVSPLDYTFAIRYRSAEHGITTFTFRARSITLCREWYLAVYKVVPSAAKKVWSPWCEVHVPLLRLSVRLPLLGESDASRITMEQVKETVLALLEQDPAWRQTVQACLDQEGLGICWTHGNRVEWVFWKWSLDHNNLNRTDLVISPQHIEQTHRLEIRCLEHTPSHVALENDKVLTEPLAVEGFLEKLTKFSGKKMTTSRLAKRRYYFASFNQFLFYIPANKIKQPDERCYYDTDNNNKSGVVVITPFKEPELDSETIKAELQRRMDLLMNATGFIDLTEVNHVRRAFDDTAQDEENNGSSIRNSITPALLAQCDATTTTTTAYTERPSIQQRERPHLEIVMDNGVTIKFEVASSELCETWVHHLGMLVLYWKAHKEAERDTYNDQHMLENGYRSSSTRTEKEGAAAEEDVDTRLWSLCCYDQCRDVVKTGIMYFQPRSRGTFTQKIFVLTCHGWLIYFNPFERSGADCQPLMSAAHKRKGALDISDCYVFSSSCLQQEQRPPRIFRDGVATDDHDDECLFSIWKAKPRRVFSPRRQRITVYSRHHFQSSEGEVWQFLTRSRAEKEEWVSAINIVIEHLLRDESNR